MSTQKPTNTSPMNFRSVSQTELPYGRNGKHKEIVLQLLSDLSQLQQGQALRIPLSDLPDSKEKIRAALNRVTRMKEMEVATASDAQYFYVWKPDQPSK